MDLTAEPGTPSHDRVRILTACHAEPLTGPGAEHRSAEEAVHDGPASWAAREFVESEKIKTLMPGGRPACRRMVPSVQQACVPGRMVEFVARADPDGADVLGDDVDGPILMGEAQQPVNVLVGVPLLQGLAGLPPTVVYGATSETTTALAAMMAQNLRAGADGPPVRGRA